MEVSFVKTDQARHRMVVVRGDGSAVTLPLYDYGAAPPHDLVHWCVERGFDLRWGFFGLVAAGAALEAVQRADARSPRRMAVVTDPLVDEHRDELLLAELLVNALDDLDSPSPELLAAVEQSGGDVGAVTDAATLAAVRADLAAHNAAWQGLSPGNSLRLSWSG